VNEPYFKRAETGDSDTGMREDGMKSLAAEIWDWIKSILIAFAVVLIIHQFVFNLSTVRGQSMEPTLSEGQWLFVNKTIYLLDEPNIGEIVILKDPIRQLGIRQYLVKRVVAGPGDSIEVRAGKLYLNGAAVAENYTDVPIEDGDYGPMTVPEDRYFVMGDNRHRNGSNDSRMFGTVPADLIEGRVEFILWPLNRIGGLN
jgi:signal peptidase I